jgi:preprotein translocase subunit YajC
MDGGSAALQNIIFFGILIAGLYFLAIRPQRKRAQELAKVRSQMSVGSAVITTAGIHATVSGIDGDIVTLEIAPGVHVRFVQQAVVRLLDETPEPGSHDDLPPAAP